jgi:FkbM family methyltransferase
MTTDTIPSPHSISPPKSITWLDRMIIFGARHRLRGSARMRSLLRGAYPISLARVQTIHGLTLAIDPESYIDDIILRQGYYELPVLNAILEHLPENGVLWDIGANEGIHSVTAKYLRPGATVVAFEPVPFIAARLALNAELNKTDIRLITTALGSSSGYADMSVKIRGNSGLSSLKPWTTIDYDSQVTCRVERADVLLAGGTIPQPNVVKVDVEGTELDVLKGFGDQLNAPSLKAVIFEGEERREDFSSVLASRGFRIRPLHQSGDERLVNFLALRV